MFSQDQGQSSEGSEDKTLHMYVMYILDPDEDDEDEDEDDENYGPSDDDTVIG